MPEGTIGNNQTAASVCLGSVGDTYFFGGLVFDALIKAPNLDITKVADHTTANPGDVVNYTTTVTNPSTRDPSDPLFNTPVSAATNLVVADQLPSGLDFVNFTNDGGGRCSYDSAARTITCNVGTLQPDAKFTYSYKATVSAAAQGDTPAALVNNACYDGNSEDQPDVVFHGCDPATVVVPPAPPAPEPADLGVVKTVSHNIVKPGDTLTWTVVGTNYGPATSTGFVTRRRAASGRVVRERERQPGADVHDSRGGRDRRIRHLHGAERPRRAGPRVVADAHDRRNGARHHRRWHPPGQHRNRVRQRR